MKLYRFYRKQMLPIDPYTAWQFFTNPKNLEEITPPWLKFKIVSDIPKKVYAGLIIQYKITVLLGISMNWITEITHVNPPYLFVDEQRFGPYKFWHHQHRFLPVADGV